MSPARRRQYHVPEGNGLKVTQSDQFEPVSIVSGAVNASKAARTSIEQWS